MIYIDIYAISLAIPTDPCSILIFTAAHQSAPSVQDAFCWAISVARHIMRHDTL